MALLKSCSSMLYQYNHVALILFTVFAIVPQGSSQTSLRCLRCISFSCDNDPAICGSMKKFVLKELEFYYQMGGDYDLPTCPDPGNLLQWESLKLTPPSSIECAPILNAKNGQATCTLGRFQVHSQITETGVNVTSYGTVTGCATKGLMDNIKASATKKKAITSLSTLIGCHLDFGESETKNSLKHFLQLEHCTRVSDMCYEEDYCIHPRYSEVRSFRQPAYDPVISLRVIIWAFVVIGILIMILTFAGIKYNA